MTIGKTFMAERLVERKQEPLTRRRMRVGVGAVKRECVQLTINSFYVWAGTPSEQKNNSNRPDVMFDKETQ